MGDMCSFAYKHPLYLTEQCRKILQGFLVGKRAEKCHFLGELVEFRVQKGHLLFVPQWYS